MMSETTRTALFLVIGAVSLALGFQMEQRNPPVSFNVLVLILTVSGISGFVLGRLPRRRQD